MGGWDEESGRGGEREKEKRMVSEQSLSVDLTMDSMTGQSVQLAYLLSKLTSFIWRVENFVVEYREVQC